MTRARELADQHKTLDVDGGTIKLDGNYPVGTNNVALGDAALDDGSLSGNQNTAVGSSALSANTTASYNTAVGWSAGLNITSGTANTAVGRATMSNTTIGSYNTVLGMDALQTNITGSYNTAVGYLSLLSNTTSYNTAVGYSALKNNTTGTRNTAMGAYDVGSGYGAALQSNTTGSNNTAFGVGALQANDTASDNSAFGTQALISNSTGANNTAVGFGALRENTSAGNNTAMGYRAGFSNTTGTGNTFIGNDTGYNSTGNSNTFVGKDAGYYITTGEKNTIVGAYHGNQHGLNITTASNYIVLSDGDGNPNIVSVYSGGLHSNHFGNTPSSWGGNAIIVPTYNGGSQPAIRTYDTDSVSRTNNVIDIRRNGSTVGSIQTTLSATSFNTSSDYRLKENVIDLTGAADRVQQLAPKRFNFIVDADTIVDGFLAHEVQSVVPEAVTGTHNEVDADGNAVMQGIDQSKLVPLLTAALQEALTKIDQLETRIVALETN